ncbi:MAG: ImmA/IrrE family metallo-endopeptidase [Solirubrobacterales bacterium]
MAISSQAKAERDAARLLRQCQVEAPPVLVEDLAEALEVAVERRPGSPDISGLLYRDDGRVVIGVNADDSPVRQRFTIAHELGHLRLHKGESLHVDRELRVNLRAPSIQGRGGEEREANWFAAALLMPERMVRSVAKARADTARLSEEGLVRALAEDFEVSRQAMGYRLVNLGLLTGV